MKLKHFRNAAHMVNCWCDITNLPLFLFPFGWKQIKVKAKACSLM